MNPNNCHRLSNALRNHYKDIECFEMHDGSIVNVDNILFVTTNSVGIGDVGVAHCREVDISKIIKINGVGVEEFLSS